MKTNGIFWWNVHDFAHFDESRSSSKRWPTSEEEFYSKASKISQVVQEFHGEVSAGIIVLAELTRSAAHFLRDKHLVDYKLHSMDSAGKPTFELAVFVHKDLDTEFLPPLVPPCMPAGSRPMAVFDWKFKEHEIRFYACHWKAKIGKSNEKYRTQEAQHLNSQIFEFVRVDPARRHVVVLGDLNAEPYSDELQHWINGSRSRVEARTTHYTDENVSRIRLYNTAWRIMGETKPHNGRNEATASAAGTYYFPDENTWHTLDQILVSSQLVCDSTPYLDESSTKIFQSTVTTGKHGRPLKMNKCNDNWVGCSDHFPVTTVINY